MLKKLFTDLKKLHADKRWAPFFDISYFVFLTFAIHYLYRYWYLNFDASIFGFQIITPGIEDFFTNSVYLHSSWIVNAIMPVKLDNNTFYFYNDCSVIINHSCSGVKQILQFAVLMLFYPGPLKHKAWFIPMGMFLVYLTNVFRIVGLSVVMNNWPQHWQFAHDYPFRVIFYVVIFLLWVWWNERFYRGKGSGRVRE
jgi:exosortase/archaeosortase family protein